MVHGATTLTPSVEESCEGRHRRPDSVRPARVLPTGQPRERHLARRGDIAAALAGIGGGLAVGSAVTVLAPQWPGPGGPATVIGGVSAVAGTYLCLMLLLLISRLPWLEREVGHDRMVAWHRHAAPWSIALIVVHVVLTTFGYATAAGANPFAELWHLITAYPWMVPATVAFVSMVCLAVISWRPIRTRMSYETWWVAHLYFYLAIALAFGHQINTGLMFTTHPRMRIAWIGLYIFVAVTIVVCRFLLPLKLSLRHQLRVSHVVQEAPGLVSIYVSGRDLSHINAAGGQFFQWRFMTRHWWWQAHPYSLSSVPSGDHLRITVRNLGDQSANLARHLRPGTRVVAEGPYGIFTAKSRRGNKVVAFAAGVGITPIRAMLDDLPASTDVTVVYRVASLDKVALHEELAAMAHTCGWRLIYLDGHRREHPMTLNYLTRYVPDIAQRDVFVCGPAQFSDAVLSSARAALVPEDRLHFESFSF